MDEIKGEHRSKIIVKLVNGRMLNAKFNENDFIYYEEPID